MKSTVAIVAFFSILPMMKSEPPINVDRMIEAIAQVEGGAWGSPGGTCCISYIAWSQHRPALAYQLSASKEHAIPVYREHVEWLIFNIPRNHVKLTPAAIYCCWHHGLDGGTKMMRRGDKPEDSVRCQNLYENTR